MISKAHIHLSLWIQAPPERCFDLARSIDMHLISAAQTQERVIGGRRQGLMELGDSVTWRAKHLGVWQTLTAQITAFERPHYFRDEMVQGAFKNFSHTHRFFAQNGGTEMQCEFIFESPLGPLGWLANQLFLKSHMTQFLQARNLQIKIYAESERWRAVLDNLLES